jgi:hypothetical protein
MTMRRLRRLAALYRQPSYSPYQHRTNDTAILDATVAQLEVCGWSVTRAAEGDVAQGDLPTTALCDADVVLNMCQGPTASEALLALENAGTQLINRASSVLGCHRHRLVDLVARQTDHADSVVAFPRTLIVSTSPGGGLDGFGKNGAAVWVKRGDVHAERREDVVTVHRDGLRAAIGAFAARGIARVALQEHVPGPVLKFYGVADGRFFRFYDAETGPHGPPPNVDEDQLRAVAFAAAKRVGLDVFGGDVALPAPDRPVLIDLNDWPSFAPFRDEAARHIAEYVHERAHASTFERILD